MLAIQSLSHSLLLLVKVTKFRAEIMKYKVGQVKWSDFKTKTKKWTWEWSPWIWQNVWWETRVLAQRWQRDPKKCNNWPKSNPHSLPARQGDRGFAAVGGWCMKPKGHHGVTHEPHVSLVFSCAAPLMGVLGERWRRVWFQVWWELEGNRRGVDEEGVTMP